MTDDEIDTIWWMAGKMKPWEFRKYMRVVFASIADTAGAGPVLVRKGRTAKDDIYAVAPADTAGANQEIKVAYQEGHFQGHHDGMKAAEDQQNHEAACWRYAVEKGFIKQAEQEWIVTECLNAAPPAPSVADTAGASEELEKCAGCTARCTNDPPDCYASGGQNADTAGAKLSASNLPEEFRIKDPADYKRTMDEQIGTIHLLANTRNLEDFILELRALLAAGAEKDAKRWRYAYKHLIIGTQDTRNGFEEIDVEAIDAAIAKESGK